MMSTASQCTQSAQPRPRHENTRHSDVGERRARLKKCPCPRWPASNQTRKGRPRTRRHHTKTVGLRRPALKICCVVHVRTNAWTRIQNARNDTDTHTDANRNTQVKRQNRVDCVRRAMQTVRSGACTHARMHAHICLHCDDEN